MSYSERDGQVILTMSRADYDFLVLGWGMVVAKSFFGGYPPAPLEFFNRLNSGNPNYTPYQVEETK